VSSLSASDVAPRRERRTGTPGQPPAISVQDVSLTYKMPLERRPTLKARLSRKSMGFREIEAVKDVTFDVKRGTVMGVMGANGAGKSTLMRMVSGILPPQSGRIEVRGRVSTLLALGVGFNRDLTGRENVVLGGLAAGLSRQQMLAKYEEIVEFAELEEFMDLPMRAYSSGMFGRLGFAVAVSMEPDILVIDEALSVGDARFKRKSFDKMRELCGQDRTIVIVSHSLGAILDLADEAVWLHKGELQMKGDPDDVVDAYAEFLGVKEDVPTMDDV
jgi:ABC-type polysaccharide/polyol phosphate transport system ATPase subunit